jgi:protein phosphatase
VNITIPEVCLVVLVGPSGSGKSTFAARHFADTEVISSDFCRGLVADDQNDQSATNAAFEVLHFIAGKRLEAGRLTVVDATNVQREARAPLVQLARDHDVLPVAITLDVPEKVCVERNVSRADRAFGAQVVRRQAQQLRRAKGKLQKEGFRRSFTVGLDDLDTVAIERERLWTDKRDQHGPFDIIGDIHGCYDELAELLEVLGYVSDGDGATHHPDGRTAVFLGDLVDRGPRIPDVLRLVMAMTSAGTALCVPGNHENKLGRALSGRKVQITHGLAESLAQIEAEPEAFRSEVAAFIDSLVSHAVLDAGNLVVAHAGLPEKLQNRASGRVRSFSLYGETTGETDEFGLPVRYAWADDYRGKAAVVYGHTPVPEPIWVNNTICLDTGCVFGGSLTALRYPERELVSVPARQTYYEPLRPLVAEVDTSSAERPGQLLDVDDVLGKRIIDTRLTPRITIREENAAAAIEVMSRFAIDPRWLVYLPPTMAPTATTSLPGLLEHPTEAFETFKRDGVPEVICEEKHMGSRAVAVVCRDDQVAGARFGVPAGREAGAIYTRTGRTFFADAALETRVLGALRTAIETSGLWDELETGWLVLDAELMPWSAKAEDLLRSQYAPVGAAASADLAALAGVAAQATRRGVAVQALLDGAAARAEMVEGYRRAYRQYCWPVSFDEGLRLAPFQILGGEGHLHAARDHRWQLQTIDRLISADHTGLLQETRHLVVDLSDPAQLAQAVAWWEALTESGGEGMVVKPVDPIQQGQKGVVQPGIKCRGREYLRIIYGPEYTAETNLERLRQRGLGRKRSLAAREFSLGIEALERFVANEPLHRVHECVFGVLALESEPVDPRL